MSAQRHSWSKVDGTKKPPPATSPTLKVTPVTTVAGDMQGGVAVYRSQQVIAQRNLTNPVASPSKKTPQKVRSNEEMFQSIYEAPLPATSAATYPMTKASSGLKTKPVETPGAPVTTQRPAFLPIDMPTAAEEPKTGQEAGEEEQSKGADSDVDSAASDIVRQRPPHINRILTEKEEIELESDHLCSDVDEFLSDASDVESVFESAGDDTPQEDVDEQEGAVPETEVRDKGGLDKEPTPPPLPEDTFVFDKEWAVVDAEELSSLGADIQSIMFDDAAKPTRIRRLEQGIERVILWCLFPAIKGIPSLGVCPASEAAFELLHKTYRGDVHAAVCSVVAGRDHQSRTELILEFIVSQIPLVGCPTAMLRSAWTNLRAVSVIAALYGHDLQSVRVQHEILCCLVPCQHMLLPEKEAAGHDKAQKSMPRLGETAKRVARIILNTALKKATGVSMVGDLCDLIGRLWSCKADSSGKGGDDYVVLAQTPASTARNYFCPGRYSTKSVWLKLVVLTIGTILPLLPVTKRNWAMLASAVIGLASVGGYLWAKRRADQEELRSSGSPAGKNRPKKTDTNWWGVKQGSDVSLVLVDGSFRGLITSLSAFAVNMSPKLFTTVVFCVMGLLPSVGAYNGVRLTIFGLRPDLCPGSMGGSVWPKVHSWLILLIGLYNLSAVLMRLLPATRPLHSLVLKVVSATLFVTIIVPTADLCLHKYGFISSQMALPYIAWVVGESPLKWKGVHLDVPTLGILTTFISSICQQRLITLLRQREVILRMLGAEKLLCLSVMLLFRGVKVALTPGNATLSRFFIQVTPPPLVCCIVSVLRRAAVFIGMVCAVTPILLQSSEGLGVSGVFVVGILAGGCVVGWVWADWCHYEAQYVSGYRLLVLLPGEVSAKARELVDGLLGSTRNVAAQYVAMSMLERVLKRLWGAATR